MAAADIMVPGVEQRHRNMLSIFRLRISLAGAKTSAHCRSSERQR